MSDDRIKRRTVGGATDLRRHPRVELPEDFVATVRDAAGEEREVTVKDMSVGGAGLIADASTFENEDFVELHIAGLDPLPGRVRRKALDGMVGMEFDFDDDDKQKQIDEELRKFRLAVADKKF